VIGTSSTWKKPEAVLTIVLHPTAQNGLFFHVAETQRFRELVHDTTGMTG